MTEKKDMTGSTPGAQTTKVTPSVNKGPSAPNLESIYNELEPRMREAKASLLLLRENMTALVGLVIVIMMIAIAICAPLICPPEPNQDPAIIPKDFKAPKPPGADGHLLGTGKWGADIFYGIIWGARTSIVTSLYVVLMGVIVGMVVGSVAGFYGGRVDNIMMRLTDIFLSLPALILAMAIASILERNLENLMLALIIVWWPGYARLIRAQVLTIKENTYVEAARAIGVKKNRILFKHIIPNSISPLIVSATMDIGGVVLTAAGLSFIGFGAAPGYAEWGRMVSDGQAYFLFVTTWEGVQYTSWWVATFPGLAILIFTMGFSLLGDGLRDILDPKLRR